MGSPVNANRPPSISTMSSPSKCSNLGSPQQLTPRSKIKALLAAVDDDSENEAGIEASKIHEDDNSADTSNRHPKSPRSSVHEPREGNAEQSDDSLVVPRGRLAARLQKKTSANGTRSSSDEGTEDESQGNAYERIKKQLLPGKQHKQASTAALEQPVLGTGDNTTAPSDRRQRLQPRKASRTSSSPIATPAGRPNSSPGLLLSPRAISPHMNRQGLGKDEDSDRDLPDPQANQRFLALVARKRAEREAKQAAEAEKKAARDARLREHSANALSTSEDESDDNAGAKRLTQQARPTRKASKKALEEMNRETQRMNRNMQLAHQAKTKKKITKESLFARFNFRTTDPSAAEAQQTLSSSTVASSVPVSDTENGQGHATPPTSPLRPSDLAHKLAVEVTAAESIQTSAVAGEPLESESELPNIQNMINNPQPVTSKKGKEKAVARDPMVVGASADNRNAEFERPPIKIRLQKYVSRSKQQDTDSDNDLEILPRQRSKSRLDAFNRLPTRKASEAHSLQTLRALAHLHSPENASGRIRASMTLSDMQTSLRQRARQQAAAERVEKIQDLKSRGVIIQTAEERQKDQAEVEDLVEKARKEAEEIKRKEKDDVRKEKRANGELVTLDDTSDEDEDYEENEENASGLELSGSDEERAASEEDFSGSENGDGDGEDDEETGGVGVDDHLRNANGLIEEEASEDAEDEGSANEVEMADDESVQDEEMSVLPQRKGRATRVIDDDDDDEAPLEPLVSLNPPTEDTLGKPVIPNLGFTGGQNLPMMGMTQAFAATMADTQGQICDTTIVDQEQDSLQFLSPVPEPNFSVFDPNDTESMVMDSQAGKGSTVQNSIVNEDISLHFSQSQIQYDTAQETQKSPPATQDEDIPDPTQDVGFGLSSPAANRFRVSPPSTVDTVLLPGAELPVKKKGRLQRGKDVAANLPNDGNSYLAKEPTNFEISIDAFDVMKKKRMAAATTKAYDKKKSEAKEMVEEQALESEDEYAGLGGASDDESGGSADEETRQMIEHGDVEVDERKLAAFHA